MNKYIILIASFQLTNEKILKTDTTSPMKYTTAIRIRNYKNVTLSMDIVTTRYQNIDRSIAEDNYTKLILDDTLKTTNYKNNDITRSLRTMEKTFTTDYKKGEDISRNQNMDTASNIKRKTVSRSLNRYTTHSIKHNVIPSMITITTVINGNTKNYTNHREVTSFMDTLSKLTKVIISRDKRKNTTQILNNTTKLIKHSRFNNRNSFVVLDDTTKNKMLNLRKVNYKKLEAEAKADVPNKENYLEPYWYSGEWVYMRVTVPRGSHGKPGSDKYPMQQYRACDYLCSNLFLYAGKVCGMRFEEQTGKKLEYKEFPSACDMEYENCKDKDKRPMYILLQRGPCPELTTLKVYPSDTNVLIKNKKAWAPFVTLPRNWTLKEFAYLYY